MTGNTEELQERKNTQERFFKDVAVQWGFLEISYKSVGFDSSLIANALRRMCCGVESVPLSLSHVVGLTNHSRIAALV